MSRHCYRCGQSVEEIPCDCEETCKNCFYTKKNCSCGNYVKETRLYIPLPGESDEPQDS